MPSISRLSAWLLLPAAISAVTFDCENVVVDSQKFNLKALGGPKEVHKLYRDSFSVVNTTFTIDVCDTLKKPKGDEAKTSCPNGSRVCAVERLYNDQAADGVVMAVFPVAGQFTTSSGGQLEPKLTRLKGSSSNEDAKKEGLRVELHGGEHTKDKKKIKQKAIVEFVCDAAKEGTEGFDDKEKMARSLNDGRMRTREDGEDGDDKQEPLPDLDEGKALQLISYEDESDVGVLRLEWKTKYACENAEKPPSSSKSWGFFTWFLIIGFLLIATYIIFGSWLNYNRYGARGWDLIPHGDTIRDIPYIVKDWTSGVAGKMGSNGNRGGYSAV
ncbi:hypothetical protein CBER1_03995 [Cercospora berteroae]|uniref:Autophagy-related protein 27 n=1 Tax=Cercospora berteroae TaxID=357750 RepID=A0A2S6CG13_9PEZI|nr:hypothetical protein CBER1_03995 [Cercospora berteroae]